MDSTLPDSEDSQALLLDVYWTREMLPLGRIEKLADQRILSPSSPSSPDLIKHDKPISTGMVSRQSQLHPLRSDLRSRHLHVIDQRSFDPFGCFSLRTENVTVSGGASRFPS